MPFILFINRILNSLLNIKQFQKQEHCSSYIINRIKEIKQIEPNATILILSPVGFVVETLKKNLETDSISFVDCWNVDFDKLLLSKIWWLNAIFSKDKLPFLIFLLKYYNHFAKPKLIRIIKQSLEADFDEATLIKEIISLAYLPV